MSWYLWRDIVCVRVQTTRLKEKERERERERVGELEIGVEDEREREREREREEGEGGRERMEKSGGIRHAQEHAILFARDVERKKGRKKGIREREREREREKETGGNSHAQEHAIFITRVVERRGVENSSAPHAQCVHPRVGTALHQDTVRHAVHTWNREHENAFVGHMSVFPIVIVFYTCKVFASCASVAEASCYVYTHTATFTEGVGTTLYVTPRLLLAIIISH